MFFKKNKTDEYVKTLMPHYRGMMELMKEIDGEFKGKYEVGFFIATIATVKILNLHSKNTEQISDEFNVKWLAFLNALENEGGDRINSDELLVKYQKRYPVYRDMFFELINPDKKDKKQFEDGVIQLTWEIFSNATGKKSPDEFLNLVLISPVVMSTTMDIYKDIK